MVLVMMVMVMVVMVMVMVMAMVMVMVMVEGSWCCQCIGSCSAPHEHGCLWMANPPIAMLGCTFYVCQWIKYGYGYEHGCMWMTKPTSAVFGFHIFVYAIWCQVQVQEAFELVLGKIFWDCWALGVSKVHKLWALLLHGPTTKYSFPRDVTKEW